MGKRRRMQITRDRRGLSPVVEKSLVTGIALLYIGSMMGLLLGGVVPTYQTATGEQLSERTLATAANDVETASSGLVGNVSKTVTIDLPPTIDRSGYELRLSDETLTLDHTDDTYDRNTTVALGKNVTSAEGRWQSGGELVVKVDGTAEERTVTIEENA